MKRDRSTSEMVRAVERIVTAIGRRVADEDPEELAQLVALQRTVNRAVLIAVRGQREHGITWEAIGSATGTTRQAAIQKWLVGSQDASAVGEPRRGPAGPWR